MWRAKRINGPATIFLMSNQGTNANDRVINMLGKLVAHRGADFVIALAVVPVGCGEALEIRNGFDIPNDHVAHGSTVNRLAARKSSQRALGTEQSSRAYTSSAVVTTANGTPSASKWR